MISLTLTMFLFI